MMEFGFGFMNNMGFSQTKDVGKKIKTRVLCIGGSTTELNDGPDVDNSYPGWLQKRLGDQYEVINAGVCGYTSAEMLINFELRLLDLKPEYLIIYEAINDVLYAGMIEGFMSDYSHSRINAGDWKNRDLTECINNMERRAAPEIPREATETFKRNIKSICSIAKTNRIEPILVKFNYNPEIETSGDIYPLKQLGLGGSEAVFLDGLKKNIKAMAQIKDEMVVAYVETEPMMREDFIDTCHFNSGGMRKMADAIAKEMGV